MTRSRRTLTVLVALIPFLALAEVPNPAAPELLKNFTARPIGPATMGGRITAVAAVESHPATLYVATASGGLWKTVNNGTTWAPVFDHQETVSLGAVAVAPSNPEVIYVGTGEGNARNSVSWGNGVYRSTDGGKTWAHLGLADTHHVGRIVIHPKNPEIAYVAALGHFWGPNAERGLYKTADGGKTWTNTKFLSEDCGFVDVVMDPENPETLLAAAYAVRRNGFSVGDPVAMQFSPLAGIYRTTDGGGSWAKVAKGLPDRPMGRIGLSVFRRNPKLIYAVIQTDKTDIRQVPGQAAKADSDPVTGGVFKSEDGGESWAKVNNLCPRPFYFGQIRVDPNDPRRLYVLGISLHGSADGGKTFNVVQGSARVHADHHAMWIDPANSEHLVLGCDGGLYFSYDRGANWEHVDALPLAQFYAVCADLRKPYWVYGGLQDNGSWGGPSANREGRGVRNHDWIRIGGGDGFYCQVDPTDPATVYGESQYGRPFRINLAKGESKGIAPQVKDVPSRFNWCSPLMLSPHNSRIVYYGGAVVYRSLDRGDNWQAISGDLTRGAPGTLTIVAESPKAAGVIWAGSDDGKISLTRDGGAKWADLSDKVPDVPPARTISRIEPGHFDAGTAYLTIDRHRNDDYKPYVFKTVDYGQTWTPLANDLPANGSVHVIREDVKNKDLLFVGTEFGLFASVNGGRHWERFQGGLPTVAVFDLLVHPLEAELVIATHGRGLYVAPIAPLQEVTAPILEAKAHLFEPGTVTAARARAVGGGSGGRGYVAPNPNGGALIAYYLKEPADKVRVTLTDALGKELQELAGKGDAGLHFVTWDLRPRVAAQAQGQMRGGRGFGAPVPPGDYVVKLTAGATTVTRKLHVEAEE